jgi:LysM repeat protein
MKPILLFFFIFLYRASVAQPDTFRLTKEDYIKMYKDDAIKDMKKTGVPASITLAQGVFESESGNSDLAREAKNHFGIKCHNEWSGETFHKDDDERNECFRKYNSVLESYDDHSNFLRTRDRYAFLFQLDITDYKGWARGLKKAGYATNPEYADKIIKIIEDFNLNELDKGADNLPLFASADKTVKTTGKTGIQGNESEKIITASNKKAAGNLKYVVAEDGASYYSIASANQMMLWQILKYNDADKNDAPAPGEVVYLEPKHSKGKEQFHIVREGENMRYISQLYAVKMKKLYKYNHLAFDAKLQAGQKIALR